MATTSSATRARTERAGGPDDAARAAAAHLPAATGPGGGATAAGTPLAHATRGAATGSEHAVPPRSGLLAASPAQLLIKRLLDLGVGVVVLLALLPVLLIAAMAVRLTSRGPIFYVDWRVGRDGRLFRMWKLRSMHVDADRRLAELLDHNEVTGPVFKMRRDPRITPVGRLLRKLSIDEVPQLFNVIRGDMSLVGPRPPLPSEYAAYSARQRRRLDVKPGVTCIWQVSGRSDIAFDDWVEMDLDYIARWNLRLDLRLLLRTLPAVISGRGAY